MTKEIRGCLFVGWLVGAVMGCVTGIAITRNEDKFVIVPAGNWDFRLNIRTGKTWILPKHGTVMGRWYEIAEPTP